MESPLCYSEKNKVAHRLLGWSVRFCRHATFVLTILAVALASPTGAATISSPYRLLDSSEQGVFNIGPSQGNVSRSFDEDVKKDVLHFTYSAPKGSVTGIWTKNFPPELEATTMNAVTIGLKIPNPGQIHQISAVVEIKGKKDAQKIPLQLQEGWNSVQESIDWDRIGDLNEVVLVVCPLGTNELAVGALSFDLDFVKLDIPPKSLAPTAVSPPLTNSLSSGDPSSFSILDAGERGIFNIGPANGDVSRISDESVNKDVLKLDYSAPSGTVIGVWTKSYSPELKAAAVNAARVGVKALNSSQTRQVSVAVEIKGAKDVQRIPLKLQERWNSVQEFIDWDKIGDLNEVVLVVSPIPGNALTTGTLFFDVDFVKQKSGASPAKKTGIIFAIGLLLALMTTLLSRLSGTHCKDRPLQPSRDESDLRTPPLKTSVLSRLKRDFIYGTATVLIAGVVLATYFLGVKSSSQAAYGFLAVALMGAVIAELLKRGLTGKHLTPAEVFQNIFLTGLLAATSSGQALLQAPANWTQVLLKSNLTAALACLIYHFANACSLTSAGRHIKAISGTLIVGTPYLFGWLLTLENVNLLRSLGNGVTGGLLSAWPALTEALGRIIVVFGFNEAFTNEISLATRGKTLNTFKAHLFAFLVSLAVVISPDIANLGSTAAVASLPVTIRSIVAVLTSMFSQAGLWAEVYLITGIFLDGIHGTAPSRENIFHHVTTGARKGMAYSGIFMAILYSLYMLLQSPSSQTMMATLPIAVGILFGALVFPLAKTLIETFDGSQAFFERMRYSYRNVWLYARGAVAGFGLAYGITYKLYQWELSDRVQFGLFIGLLASAGISILRDAVYASQGRGRIQSWRLYFIDALLGGFVGSAMAFYLDAAQVPVIIDKFKLYTGAGLSPTAYTTYPLVSKWGRIDLGAYTGGVKMFFNEALAGVINWAVAAWLFAINRAFMEAYFHKDCTPIKHFFSKAGFVDLSVNMIQVLRWGLWMSPIINTFLRMMPEATWYNQDGAIRTLFAIYHNATMSSEDFQAWSLQVFVYLLAYDVVRILIWIDHMGLRVATLVNLSFIGMNKLDERIARFIGPASAQRYIPEAVKRFTTWAPLLIPFYIPRGPAWDYAWNTAGAIQNAAQEGGILSVLRSLALTQILLLMGLAILVCTVISFIIRSFTLRSARRRERVFELSNREYKVVLKESGEGYSQVVRKGYDISRRSYDTMDPCGRVLYLVDSEQKPEDSARSWPVIGNFPKEDFEASRIEAHDGFLRALNTSNGIRTTIQIRLPDQDSSAELWTVTVENLTDKARRLKVIPYLEWVLDRSGADRGHTQYARLFPVMEYASGVNAILTWQKNTKAMGILASDAPPEGFLTSRMDFIGRARSIWAPRIVETLNFLEARETSAYPTFDPIGSLMVNATVDPKGSRTMRFMIGYAKNKEAALELIHKHLQPKADKTNSSKETNRRSPLIGHGEIPPGAPQPYSEFVDHGNKLLIHTPYTPRPYDHALSNALGQYVTVTNRGLHTSSNGNSQQNRLTPDWPDTVTREVPAEAIYLYDPEKNEWYSPTHHPLNDVSAKNESEFGVDGTALFRMTRGTISTELTVFVPPDELIGVYLLTVKNNADHSRRMRIASYFQIILAGQPEWSGPLGVNHDKTLNALFFENPRNTFRSGPAFASVSIPSDCVETKRGRFFGTHRGVAHPYLVEKGEPDVTQLADTRPIAGFLGTLEIAARGECTVAVILGQTDDKKQAIQLIQKYRSVDAARTSLEKTRKWWLGMMSTVEVRTNHPEFDEYQNWLKYQAIAERIWARRGFYQTSGAYGFRDQLQDTVNLIWVDPALARKQILLHASQQFIEGDVFHWFFTLIDGRTAFANRSHASDNLLWLAWGVAEYVKATGDDSILDEMTTYVVSENPFQPLPQNKHGWGDIYHRSTRADTVYRHCMKSIDLVLEKRMGKNGLPLIGTGDWNDGLDEIGSNGKGESVWLGFFLDYILKNMIDIIEKKDGPKRQEHYLKKIRNLEAAIERTWKGDRYLRAIHDDGTEIGVKDSGVWEIDALTAAWAVMSEINPERGLVIFNTALHVLEKENVILLGWPALREDTKPYLGRSSHYPEGVRENGMYCHGVQWLIKAARILAERLDRQGDRAKANEYRATAYRLWLKIAPISHVTPREIEIYGGQPNKQSADMLTTFDQGRMIWNGYTGAAGWMLRQAFEGVVGASLIHNELVLPTDLDEPRGALKISRVYRDVKKRIHDRVESR